MLLPIHPVNPQPRSLKIITDCLLDGGIVVYPTDTLYGLGCDIFQRKAVERISRIKVRDPEKAQMSFICHDLSDLSRYTRSISTSTYRMLKKFLPGPYTFILPASRLVPRLLKSKKNSIGLRIPDNLIARRIARELGHPLLSNSLPGKSVEELTDPEIIHGKFGNLVDIVVDGGIGGAIPSTVVDCTGTEPVLVRKGLGEWTDSAA
jgi:tRNA threonylcarbamoyl adenosine modification protein (Sua5/YciO/YrdC/YwlC family)